MSDLDDTLDDTLDATLREMIAREAVWDADDVDDRGGADALVAAIAAERAEIGAAPSRRWARWMAPVAAGVAAAAVTTAAYGLVRDDTDTTETAGPEPMTAVPACAMECTSTVTGATNL